MATRSYLPRTNLCSSIYLLLLLLLSCGPERVERQLTPADTLLEEALSKVREDYRQLHLPAALAAARTLPLRQATEVGLRAEAYQYLAMLHYERGLFRDSIGHYTELAGALIGKEASPQLQARQQVCHAMVRYYDWRWQEMDLACALGLRILARSGDTGGELTARLLLLQGIARKMYALNIILPDRREALLLEAAELMREAIDRYAARGAPRQALAYEELGIIYARLPDYDHRVAAILDSLPLIAVAGAPGYVYPERLRGYRYRRSGKTDSVRYYYEFILKRPTILRYEYVSEAQFVLREQLRDTEDFAAALTLNQKVLREADCCTKEVKSCQQWSGCVYDVVEQAAIYFRRYRRDGVAGDLEQAYRLSQSALGQYDDALGNLTEEEAFNRLITLGDRLITVALEIAHAQYTVTPERQYLNAVFRTIEYGKSYLLNKELAQLRAVEKDRLDVAVSDSLAVTERNLNLLKKRYFRREQSLTTRELREAESLIRRRGELTERLTPAFSNVFADRRSAPAGLTIAAVQQQLAQGQALLEFTEAAKLTAVYIDRDTAVVYAIDTTLLFRVRRLVESIGQLGRSESATPDTLATAVSDSLLGPVASLLRQRTDLLLAPSVSLDGFPFAVLPAPRPAGDTAAALPCPYLIERFSLRYVDSWQTERYNADRRRTFATNDPPRVGIWTHPALSGYLGGLGRQLMRWGNVESHHFVGGNCSGEQLLARGGGFDLLHLSVHARGSTVHPNDNYLYLNHRDSLNGLHIGGRRLAARLVVLAACATARGVSRRREGTYSIRRSFHLAGVPDVVASLYDIPAAATAGILEEFYRGLRRGLSPERALAMAQRACLHGRLDRRWVGAGWWGGLVVG